MYTHPRATINSAHPAVLTVSNGHTNDYAMDQDDDYGNGYAKGHTSGNAIGHPKEKLVNSVVVMRRPNPLDYPFITVKAVQVVRPRYLLFFFRVNIDCLSSFGLHAQYLDRSCGARSNGINITDDSLEVDVYYSRPTNCIQLFHLGHAL